MHANEHRPTKIEVAAGKVADLDRRLNQVDTVIEEAVRRPRTRTALDAMEGQRRARAVFAGEHNVWQASRRNALPWPPGDGRLRSRRAPIRYVAELVGADTDSERAIRYLIALMVLTCDPLAIALMAAASARR